MIGPEAARKIGTVASEFGFSLVQEEPAGYFYHDRPGETAVLVDVGICDRNDLPYTDYTARHNTLSHNYRALYRFLYDTPEGLREAISSVLEGEPAECHAARKPAGRDLTAIDPSGPEALFEDLFADAFGVSALGALRREHPHEDLLGSTRYIDYALWTRDGAFAIELNGESFHHPAVIGPVRYRSQLLKQNSLVRDGFKVLRWSARGMADRERMIGDLRVFLGDPDGFRKRPQFLASRRHATIELYDHQEDALELIAARRAEGRDSFLLVLPTGTGKTEIFLEDIGRFADGRNPFSALVIVPTRKLRDQTIERVRLRLPAFVPGTALERAAGREIVVQTSATMNRRHETCLPDRFDYIVVDEAHHAMAAGLRRTLEHFKPGCLLGVTATPDRTDSQKLEELFGEYESVLSLREAIERGLVPPVRCFRIKSNIDLSEVRFNGRDYVASDLQKTVVVPSRDQIVAQTLLQYFGGSFADKQGLVFCVSVDHAKRMAVTLNAAGMAAAAVSGSDREGAVRAIAAYDAGEVRFLCACDLLSEGWDAPQTQILVMARPTFSRVLYTQQLGRGTRRYPGKEAFYVLDVVDNYGARHAPLSLHALFGIDAYRPFDDVVGPPQATDTEIVVLDGLYEGIRRVEPVDIFNYEDVYGSYLNEEQLARELFVSTGSVLSWIRKGSLTPDHTVPFGRRTLRYFRPERVEEIRQARGLKEHTAESRRQDFLEFVRTGDYTFSYKMVFMLAFLRHMSKHGDASLDDISRDYVDFYRAVLAREGRCDRSASPYNRTEYLEDEAAVRRNMLENPFEKFERKRFMHHCKDLNAISLDGVLLGQLTSDDYEFVRRKMAEDMTGYFAKEGIGVGEEEIRRLRDE